MKNYKAIISIEFDSLNDETAKRRAKYLLYLFNKEYNAKIEQVNECIVKSKS